MEEPFDYLLVDIGRRVVTLYRRRHELKRRKQRWFDPWERGGNKHRDWQADTERIAQQVIATENDLNDAIEGYLASLQAQRITLRKDTTHET